MKSTDGSYTDRYRPPSVLDTAKGKRIDGSDDVFVLSLPQRVERFGRMGAVKPKFSTAALIFGSLDDEQSLNNIPTWVNEQQSVAPDYPVVIVLTGVNRDIRDQAQWSDDCPNKKAVLELLDYCESMLLPVVEVSAKDNIHVDLPFLLLHYMIKNNGYNREPQQTQASSHLADTGRWGRMSSFFSFSKEGYEQDKVRPTKERILSNGAFTDEFSFADRLIKGQLLELLNYLKRNFGSSVEIDENKVIKFLTKQYEFDTSMLRHNTEVLNYYRQAYKISDIKNSVVYGILKPLLFLFFINRKSSSPDYKFLNSLGIDVSKRNRFDIAVKLFLLAYLYLPDDASKDGDVIKSNYIRAVKDDKEYGLVYEEIEISRSSIQVILDPMIASIPENDGIYPEFTKFHLRYLELSSAAGKNLPDNALGRFDTMLRQDNCKLDPAKKDAARSYITTLRSANGPSHTGTFRR